jgi:lauroyl/myristoyl acyltransferase
LVIALLKVCRRFPIKLRRLIVSTLALFASFVSWRKRRLFIRGLEAAAIERLDATHKRAIARAAVYRFWRETFWMAPTAAEVELTRSMPLHGEEHLREALGRGKGVILLESNTLGSRVLARGILHAHGYALHQVHMQTHLGSGFVVRPADRNWASRMLGRFFETCEKEFLAEIIYLPPTDSMAFTRVMLDRLRRNSIICLAGDGRYGQRLIEVPFLGVPKLFSTGMISLARSSGATVLPLFCLGEGYLQFEAVIEPPIDVESSAERDVSVTAAVAQFAEVLARYAATYKEQYSGWPELGVIQQANSNRASRT